MKYFYISLLAFFLLSTLSCKKVGEEEFIDFHTKHCWDFTETVHMRSIEDYAVIYKADTYVYNQCGLTEVDANDLIKSKIGVTKGAYQGKPCLIIVTVAKQKTS